MSLRTSRYRAMLATAGFIGLGAIGCHATAVRNRSAAIVTKTRRRRTIAVMRFSVFGREVLVTRSETGWEVFYRGEGKRRPALDIPIPPDIPEAEIEQYLGDLCHEWATERHPSVRQLEE